MLRIAKSILYFLNYIRWLYRFLKLKLGFNTLRDIEIISFEFASVCNLRCKYCFIEQGQRRRFLDVSIYEKLIKEVAENPKYRIKAMEWPISGEFFVYKGWKQVVDITRKYMDANPHFRPHVILNENLTLFDEEKIDYILRSGVVRQIICSIDGHDAGTFEDMRPPANFEVVKRNFCTLVRKNKELGNPVWIQINNGRDENSLGRSFSGEMKEILRQADEITFWQPQCWNESFNKREGKFYPAQGPCTFVFNNVTLSVSGHIAKCCMDLKGATTYADLAEHSLEEIWHSDVRKKFLELMFKGRRTEIQGCNTCSITATNNDNRFNHIFRALKRLALTKGWLERG